MSPKFGVNIIIEREKVNGEDVFIASSSDINVLAEGKTIDESKEKFLEGLRTHLETFPEEKSCLLIKDRDNEMPMITRVFL